MLELKSINIQNFKSIKEWTSILIEKIWWRCCLILLGINESGKSNILEAINLINNTGVIDYKSLCHKDKKKDDIFVSYRFDVDENQVKEAIKKNNETLPEDLIDWIKFEYLEKYVLISEWNKREDDFDLTLSDNEKLFNKYVRYSKNITHEDWTNKSVVVIEPLSDENKKIDSEGKITNILKRQQLEVILQEILKDIFSNNIPRTIIWESKKEYLINESIDLNQFKENPDISIPLKNCFTIAWIKDIKKTIEDISGDISEMASLKDDLSKKVTQHINEVWKEHKINVRFETDNMAMFFLIEDKDNDSPKYEVQQRSEWFKHFMSILLNLSAEYHNEALKNKIILLDEPETHLHPSWQKYLRDELLKISEENIVIYATHSIYMVDRSHIDRHLSINKVLGETTITPIEADDPYKEEVLYEALGTSILEIIENNVLIFEWKTDRDIFDLYRKKFKKCPNITLLSADWCNNIQKYAKFFNIKIIKWYILTDSDTEWKQTKDKILKDVGWYTTRNTFEINNISNTWKESTLEDLFDKIYIIESVFEMCGLKIDIDETKPYLSQIEAIFHENKKAFRKDDKENLKNIFFKKILKLQKNVLQQQTYFDFYSKLTLKIK